HMLHRGWNALQQHERKTRQPVYQVLRLHFAHPALSSARLARILSMRLGKPVTAGWVRKWIAQGRQRLAAFLLAEGARTLVQPSREILIEELGALQLLSFCRAALGLQESASAS